MTTSIINSVLARCLAEPAFLERLSQHPLSTLADYNIDKSSSDAIAVMEFDKLRAFAGFVTKVQNKDLLNVFQRTVSLLHERGLQIQAFTQFREVHQRNRRQGRRSLIHRIESFSVFLEHFLAAQKPAARRGIFELLTHERILWEIKSILTATDFVQLGQHGCDPSALSNDLFGQLIPTVMGALRIAYFDFDPLLFLLETKPSRSQSLRGPTILAYWGDRVSKTVRTFVIDRHTALILSDVDNSKSVNHIVDSISSRSRSRNSFNQFRYIIESLVHSGLLVLLPEPSPSTSCEVS